MDFYFNIVVWFWMFFFRKSGYFPMNFQLGNFENWKNSKIGEEKPWAELSRENWRVCPTSKSVILVVQYKIILWIDQTRGQGTAEMAALDSKATQKAFRSSAGPSVLLLLWQMMSIVLQDLTQKASWRIQSIHCAQILFLDQLQV